jgi:hypothetical protein
VGVERSASVIRKAGRGGGGGAGGEVACVCVHILPFKMFSYPILADVFRQISNPQVTCLSNHFAPNSSFGIGCCAIVWRHCTTTHNSRFPKQYIIGTGTINNGEENI